MTTSFIIKIVDIRYNQDLDQSLTGTQSYNIETQVAFSIDLSMVVFYKARAF